MLKVTPLLYSLFSYLFFCCCFFFMSEMTVQLHEEHRHFRESFSIWWLKPKHFISTLSVLSRASPPKLSVPKLLWHNSYMHTDKIAIQESAKAYFPYSAYGWNHRSSTINDNHPKIKHVLLLHQKEHRTSSIVIITIIRYVLLLLCF